MTEPTAIHSPEALLGEGPVWDDRRGVLYWLDILGNQLHSHEPRTGVSQSLTLPLQISALALRENGQGLVAVGSDGFGALDPETGDFEHWHHPEADLSTNRFNDGKVDPAGRFLAGSMDLHEKCATGQVYALNPDHHVQLLFGSYTVCNGPAFSLDGKTLYFCDSDGQEVLAFPYDAEVGHVSTPRQIAKFSKDDGYPDGLTVDAEDHIWVAHWDGWRLSRFSPDGVLVQTIDLPVPRVTSCTFGGADLDTLYITSARVNLDDAALAKAPLAGSLFAVKPGVKGVPAARFLG